MRPRKAADTRSVQVPWRRRWRYIAFILTGIIAAAWLLSTHYAIGYILDRCNCSLWLREGRLEIWPSARKRANGVSPVYFFALEEPDLRWTRSGDYPGARVAIVPLWIPTVLSASVLTLMYLRRQGPYPTCAACGYNLSGLKRQTPCPECGRTDD